MHQIIESPVILLDVLNQNIIIFWSEKIPIKLLIKNYVKVSKGT